MSIKTMSVEQLEEFLRATAERLGYKFRVEQTYDRSITDRSSLTEAGLSVQTRVRTPTTRSSGRLIT